MGENTVIRYHKFAVLYPFIYIYIYAFKVIFFVWSTHSMFGLGLFCFVFLTWETQLYWYLIQVTVL